LRERERKDLDTYFDWNLVFPTKNEIEKKKKRMPIVPAKNNSRTTRPTRLFLAGCPDQVWGEICFCALTVESLLPSLLAD
jgi:hypothetical protein